MFAPGHLSTVEGNQKTEKFGSTLNSYWPTSAELSAWPKQFSCLSLVSCSMQKISEPSKDFSTFSRYLICPSSLLLSTDDPSFCFMEKIKAIRYKFWQLSCQHSHSNFFSSVQFSSVAQTCPTLCDPMNRSTSGLPVHHQLPEFTQTHIHRVRDAIQPSHPLSSPSPPAPSPSQHRNLFQWVNSSHEVAKVLEFQL